METSPDNTLLSQKQRISLILFSLILSILLLFARAGIQSNIPLDKLARQSLSPEVALANGRPTILEFYADWCIACKEMAPAILSIHDKLENQVDFVLLNVDNNVWKDLIDQYEINGIPQLIFFDSKGKLSGRSIGVRSDEDLGNITNALLNDDRIQSSFEDDNFSDLNRKNIISS